MTHPPEHQSPAPRGVTVLLQPSGKTCVVPPKPVHVVLAQLNIRPTTVLVIREGGLLTPDTALKNGDSIIVRTVVSSG
ncbi:hypothetical protein [Desulfovibrio psychrotolerans]|uniref:hypothetical protein n=1 Tax=Desulfovibrio psychrotolerans TaxID=415242 RepID=UPI00157B7A6D|nr:hypothetical protein [Desulfovibrio psychrotolerans]